MALTLRNLLLNRKERKCYAVFILFSCLVCAILACVSLAYLNLDQTSADAHPAAPEPALQSAGLSRNFAQATPSVPAAARKELLAAAKAHGVSIKADKIAYVDNQKVTIVRAPIKGIDKYSDADFAKGAPIVLMIIKSKVKLAVPDGSYVVRVQYQRNAKSGKAIFTDAGSAVVAVRDLDAPVLTLPDPDFPDPKDHGESGVDICKNYAEMFPRVVLTDPLPGTGARGISLPCRDCACDTYNWWLLPGRGPGGLGAEAGAFWNGRSAGQECMASRTSTCAPLPRLP
jgi:hypothetical protein